MEQLKNLSILCVEDEAGIRKRLVSTLKNYFETIYEAQSGNDGYEKYCEFKPDIIISDIQMQDGDGISMVQKIREKDLETKIIMITAHSKEEYLIQLINCQVNHYILKPYNSTKLLAGLLLTLNDRITDNLDLGHDILMDVSKRELLYENECINLRKRECVFLQLLHKNRNHRITYYEEIESALWKDKIMTQSALKTFIKEVRQKLPKDIITNIPRDGYKLT
jgi:DNA-binding response OmpR family regulator